MIQGIFRSPFLRYIKSLYIDENLTNSFELVTLKRSQQLSCHKHELAVSELTSIAWCDKCDGIIFGVQNLVYKCLDCNYTCHAECRSSANLPHNLDEQLNSASYPQHTNDFLGIPDRRFTLQINYDLTNSEKLETSSELLNHYNPLSLDEISSGGSSLTNSQSSLCLSSTDSVSTTTNTLKSINDTNNNMESSYVRFDGLSDDESSSWATLSSPSSPMIIPECMKTISPFTQFKTDASSLDPTGAYIHLGVNILRPIYVAPGQKLASLDQLNHLPPSDPTLNSGQTSSAIMVADEAHTSELSAFFLPCNTYTDIYVTPETTAVDVVKSFLHKFDIVDNVRKFELYHKRTSPQGKVFLHKLDADEKLWEKITFQSYDSMDQTALLPPIQFILKDHVEAEILWDSFSIPELYNFLQILNYEESQGIDKIKAKYDKKRKIIAQSLHSINPASTVAMG